MTSGMFARGPRTQAVGKLKKSIVRRLNGGGRKKPKGAGKQRSGTGYQGPEKGAGSDVESISVPLDEKLGIYITITLQFMNGGFLKLLRDFKPFIQQCDFFRGRVVFRHAAARRFFTRPRKSTITSSASWPRPKAITCGRRSAKSKKPSENSPRSMRPIGRRHHAARQLWMP